MKTKDTKILRTRLRWSSAVVVGLLWSGFAYGLQSDFDKPLVESISNDEPTLNRIILPPAEYNPLLSRTRLYDEVLELLKVKPEGFVASQLGTMTLTEIEYVLRNRMRDLDISGQLDADRLREFDSIFLGMKVLRDEKKEKN